MILVPVLALSVPAGRKWKLLAVGILGAAACAGLLYRLFPEFGGWFRPERMLETARTGRGYASTGDLNRLNCISQINFRLAPDAWQRVFGLGLGNCGYAGVDFLTTPFYREYAWLHYTWMSVPYRYLEGGYVGLGFYMGFFLLVFWKALRVSRHRNGKQRAEAQVSAVLALMCILVSIYNASLGTEAGYLIYFALSQPVGRREWKEH